MMSRRGKCWPREAQWLAKSHQQAGGKLALKRGSLLPGLSLPLSSRLGKHYSSLFQKFTNFSFRKIFSPLKFSALSRSTKPQLWAGWKACLEGRLTLGSHHPRLVPPRGVPAPQGPQESPTLPSNHARPKEGFGFPKRRG